MASRALDALSTGDRWGATRVGLNGFTAAGRGVRAGGQVESALAVQRARHLPQPGLRAGDRCRRRRLGCRRRVPVDGCGVLYVGRGVDVIARIGGLGAPILRIGTECPARRPGGRRRLRLDTVGGANPVLRPEVSCQSVAKITRSASMTRTSIRRVCPACLPRSIRHPTVVDCQHGRPRRSPRRSSTRTARTRPRPLATTSRGPKCDSLATEAPPQPSRLAL